MTIKKELQALNAKEAAITNGLQALKKEELELLSEYLSVKNKKKDLLQQLKEESCDVLQNTK